MVAISKKPQEPSKEFRKVPLPAGLHTEIKLTDNARTVLRKRYLRKGEDGEPIETEAEMFWRVAYHVALAQKELGGSDEEVEAWARKYYDLLTDLRFFPNSPTFTGGGTPLGQLAACFVLPIQDDMGRTGEGIFETLRNAALIQQTGGGNGFAFSRLRPKGAIVKSSNGAATGPVGFLRVYDQAFGEIAQGGCLTPDTLVFTDRGLLRLDEIVTHNYDGWCPHEFHVSTDEGMRPSYQGYNNGVSPVLRVITAEGIELTGTPNHKVKVMTSEGLNWRRFDELQPGDSIPVMLGQHQGTLQSLIHPKRQHGNQIMPEFPTALNEKFAFLLGYMSGDGFIASGENDHRLGVSVAHDSYLLDEIPEIFRHLFGENFNIHRQQKENDASATFVVDNRALKDFFLMNGLDKAKSGEVAVPKLIRQSPPKIVGAYLRGLFEADGTISHGYPGLCSTSKTLIQEVATLLIGLGCPVQKRLQPESENRYGSLPMWQLTIRSFRGLEAWRENIGCDSRSRFQKCLDHMPDLSRETCYTLPHAEYWIQPVLEATTLPQIDKRGTGKNLRSTTPSLRKRLLRYQRGDRQLTLSGYTRLSQQYAEFAEFARPVEDLWFVTVSSIEDGGEALTLDIEVEENHTYLANGCVTHNSRRGANMAVLRVDHPDIRDFIKCKASEGAIENFNISVGITDEFMEAVNSDSDFDLINPQNGEVWETVRARDIFDMIVEHAYRNGEPGVLFLDAANRENPVPHLYELESTNPCVTGDTLVATPSGWKRADEFSEGDEICTVLGIGKVATIETHEAVPVFEVTFSDGDTLRTTAAHQFHVRDASTKFFEPRRLDEIEPGQWVRVYKGAMPNNPVPQGNVELEDRDYGFLVGALIGDGCYTPHVLSKGVVRFSSHADEEEWNAILEQVLTKAGATGVYTYVNKGSRSMLIDPKPGRVIAKWVQSIPLEAARGPEKTIPECFINSNREFLTGLIDGLFSTDGSVDLSSNHPLIRFHTASPELAKQVRRILLMFGIHGRIHKTIRKRHSIDGRLIRNDRPKYDVIMSGINFGGFFEQITLSHPDKQYRMEDAALRSNFTGGNWAAKVVSIEPAGVEKVYDLYEPRSDTWVTNGYVSRGCGEQYLGPFENCCLGSINLAQHVTSEGQVDWEKLAESIDLSTRFLDHVVTANAYVPAVPELRQAAEQVRRIGLGIMGLGDMMYALGIRYGSQEGQEFASQIMEFVRYHSMRTGIQLARENHPFLAIEGSRYDPQNLGWTIPQPIVEHLTDWGQPALDWHEIVSGLKKYGIRNGAQTTVAPTGTISTVSGIEGYGCEPVFALAYTRYVVNNAGNSNDRDALQYTSPAFEKALRKSDLSDETIQKIIAQVNKTGSCQDVPEVPESIRRVFVVAGDISAEEHIRMQAAMQAWVDNAISKTANFPATATQEDVAKAYFLGWELGCKGLTVYVTGSREKVVLETKATQEKKSEQPVATEQPMLFNEDKKPRPRQLSGKTYRIETPAGATYITINENGYGEGHPFEVFVQTGKAGSEIMALSEAIGRTVSQILRMSSPVSPRKRLKEIVRQLNGIGGERSLGFGPNKVRSLPDGIAQVLQEYLNQSEAADELTSQSTANVQQKSLPLEEPAPQKNFGASIGDICPSCGSATLVNEEGCQKCYSCGHSEC